MANSAFSPNLTITGSTNQSGEINIVTNPSAVTDASTGWTSSSVTLSRVASGSPLDPTVPTGFQAVSTTTTTSFISTVALSVPTSLRNRKLKVQFNQALTDSSMWKIDVFKSNNTTRYTLSTDSSSVTVLPALTGTFTTTFDMDTDTAIYVRFTRYAGAGTSTLNFTNLIVGPGIQPQGAVAQEWISYTPTGPWSTNTTYTGKYRRVGDSLELIIDLSLAGAPTTASLIFTEVQILNGLNLNVDATKFPVSSDFAAPVGVWSALDSGISGNYGGQVTWNGSQLFAAYPTSTTTASVVNQAQPFTFGTNDNISLRAVLPISQWSGSGTVQLAQNDVEWAANDGTNNVYGPSGTAIPTTSTGAITRTITFQTPIQSTDIITVEYTPSVGGQWLSNVTSERGGAGTNWSTYSSASEVGWGEVRQVSSTQVTVVWRRYKLSTTNWGGSADGYWRVRKSSAGAAVGFGLADANSSGLVNPYTTGSGIFYNGTYTPTLTAVSGTPAGTVQVAQYVRLGKLVYVSGIISGFSFGALNNVEFRLTVPLARNTNFSASVGASGVGVWARGGVTTGGISFQISPYTSANNQVTVYTTSPSGTGAADVFAYNFSYLLDF